MIITPNSHKQNKTARYAQSPVENNAFVELMVEQNGSSHNFLVLEWDVEPLAKQNIVGVCRVQDRGTYSSLQEALEHYDRYAHVLRGV